MLHQSSVAILRGVYSTTRQSAVINIDIYLYIYIYTKKEDMGKLPQRPCSLTSMKQTEKVLTPSHPVSESPPQCQTPK